MCQGYPAGLSASSDEQSKGSRMARDMKGGNTAFVLRGEGPAQARFWRKMVCFSLFRVHGQGERKETWIVSRVAKKL